MPIIYEELKGLWQINSWQTNVIKTKDTHPSGKPRSGKAISINVWDEETLHSHFYDFQFKRKISKASELKDYTFYFTDVKDSFSESYEIELYNHITMEFLGSILFRYNEPPSEYNIEFNGCFGQLKQFSKTTAIISEIMDMRMRMTGIRPEYITNEIAIEKINDSNRIELLKKIKKTQTEKEYNAPSNLYFLDEFGNKVEMTQGEMHDTLLNQMGEYREKKQRKKQIMHQKETDKEKKKWWEFWKL